MNDAASETRVYPSRAAANRALAAHRSALIAELGWTPEGTTADEKYVATMSELEQEVNGLRAKQGKAPVLPTTFTNTFNLQRVKALTVFRFDVQGTLISE